MIAIKINAGNDKNGNPRRGWIVVDTSGTIERFVDESYEGKAALSQNAPHVPEMMLEIPVAPRLLPRGQAPVRALIIPPQTRST